MSDQAFLAEQFESKDQQREAAQLGMWVFLGSEIMLFGGVFLGIFVYRLNYTEPLQKATHHLHLWLGGTNTAVLLTSSLTMALAVTAARAGRRGATIRWLLLTALLGVGFLCIKGYEYSKEYYEGLMPGIGPAFPLQPPETQLFYNLYFAATGLHALHLSCAVLAATVFIWLIGSRRVHLPGQEARVETLSLYWHLVDVVWVFLFSSLYLI
jgi:cytochrome c oxidase subunit 3